MRTLFILILPALLWAQSSSENYTLTKSVLDAGGGTSTSENFRLVSAFGQPTPIGVQTSTNFTLFAGFLSPMLLVSPLSPIQELVIKEAQPDARLYWEHVPGAGSYSIYRDILINFVPGPSNFVATVADTFYTDTNVFASSPEQQYYIVRVNNP